MKGPDMAFEVFVRRTIEQLKADVKGWTEKSRALRAACTTFLDELAQVEGQMQVVAPLPKEVITMVLKPLVLGCNSEQPAAEEHSLAVLHKLVAHAWLQGETSVRGSMTDDANIVVAVSKLVVKCADSLSSAVHLSVIRALLTITTSEHFVPHGECLVLCIRTVFNLAIASEDANIKRTACNALLQMLNTVVKRIAQVNGIPSSRRASGGGVHSFGGAPPSPGHSASGAASSAGGPPPHDVPNASANASLHGVSGRPSSNGSLPFVTDPTNRTAHLVALAEQRDLRGLEAALGDITPPPDAASAPPSQDGAAADLRGAADPRPTAAPRRPSHDDADEGMPLDVLEADMVFVLHAMCKLAAREANMGAVDIDAYVLAGKHLALELLAKVMEQQTHPWGCMRQRTWAMLRQPLCLVLLRSSSMADETAFPLAARLFVALLLQPPLRSALKAEMCAFFPLLLLRPMESESVSPAALTAALLASAKLCADPQLLLDIFVNYDCDLQATNVFERMVSGLRRVVAHSSAIAGSPAQRDRVREAAITCICTVPRSLESWVQSRGGGFAVQADAAAAVGGIGGQNPPPEQPDDDNASHFEAIKAIKDSRTAGMIMFEKSPVKGIKFLQKGGVVGASALDVATWLRANLSQLNRDAIGEYFGIDNEFCIAVMHAWIDQEEFAGMAFDAALRQLLREFKLPGEAQQIDRIMEKFAEAYCRANPAAFAIADDAYRLAFAVIMLNTDAHNPMAEHMLSLPTFIEMNTQTSDDGEERSALPRAELEAIFHRIQASEIEMVGNSASDKGPPAKQRQDRMTANPLRLAAALGLASTFMPFRGSGSAITGQASNVEEHHIKPPVHAVGSTHWHTARSTDHVRHMLQVAGPSILEVLKLGLQQQSLSDKMFLSLLDAVRLAVRLAGQMALHALCEDIMTALCDATGVYQPDIPGTKQAERQLLALQTLLKIGCGPDGALLTSSWWLLLRCISTLEALQCSMQENHIALLDAAAAGTSPPEPGLSLASVEAGMKSMLTSVQAMLHITPHSNRPTQLASSALFSSQSSGTARRGHEKFAGAQLVQWAFEGEGAAVIDAVYERSATLDGEGIIMFMRALCAVSQQELQPTGGAAPRVWSLQKLVECSFHNVGRIRLVWARIWALVSPHMVAAACHEHPGVAMTAVDALKQLVAQLLQRSELMFFNWQQDALAPFVAILKHAGSVMVRELAVQCLKNTLQSNPRGLGSGWAGVLQALEVAVCDSKLALVTEGISTLRLAVSAAAQASMLVELLPRLALVCTLAALNHSQSHLCFDAMKCLGQCADALAAASVGMSDEELPNGDDESRSRGAGPGPGSTYGQNSGELPPLSMRTASMGSLDSEFIWTQQPDLWVMLLSAAAHVAAHAVHDTVSEQGAEEAVHMLQKYSTQWSPATLQRSFDCVLQTLFDCTNLSPSPLPPPAPTAPSSLRIQSPLTGHTSDALRRLLTRVRTYLPSLMTILVTQYVNLGPDRLRAWLLTLVRIIELPDMDAVSCGVAALQQASSVVGQAAELDSSGWQALVDTISLASSTDTRPPAPLADGVASESSLSASPSHPPVPNLRSLATCLMQYSITEVLSQCGQSMPPSVQLQLLDVLHATAERAASFNRSTALRAACADSFRHAAVHLPAELDVSHLPPPGTFRDVSDTSMHDASAASTSGSATPHEAGNSEIRAEARGSQGSLPSSPPRAHPRRAVLWTIKLATSSSQGPTLPALMRQEAEGGLLLINAYLRTIRSFRESAARHPSLVEAADCAATAEAKLLHICRTIINACVDECTEDAMAHSDWVAAVHAPLLCHSLRAFCDLHGDGLVKELKLMLPSLCKLMRSAQVMVRSALADMLDRALWPLILQASAG